MTARNTIAQRVTPKPQAAAAPTRITGAGIWNARHAKGKERQFTAAARRVARAHTQSADTPTGQPPAEWRVAFNLAQTKRAGITYLSAFDCASVEAPAGVIFTCATPADAEKILRAYRPVGGSK